MNNTEFVKINNKIYPKSKGMDYELECGKIYNLVYDGFSNTSILELNENILNMPKKIYESNKDKLFKERVLTYYKNADTQTTGVMLAGTKGTGKSLLAKLIAIESNLPIIIVDGCYPAYRLEKYFSNYKNTEICILFDEIEKKWKTEDMLGFLDGIENTAKKLILMTCNDLGLVSNYMQDRCSRVRYLRKYGDDENIELIPEILKDNNLSDNKELEDFIKKHIKLLSIDNIIAFIKEYNLFKDKITDLNDLINNLNISTCNRTIENNTENIELNDSEFCDQDDTKNNINNNSNDLDSLIIRLATHYNKLTPSYIKECLEEENNYINA